MLPIRHRSSDCSPRRACLAAALPSIAADRWIAPGDRWCCVVPGFAEYASVRRRCRCTTIFAIAGRHVRPAACTHPRRGSSPPSRRSTSPSARVALCRALRIDDPAGVLTDRATAVEAACSLAELGAARAPRPSAATWPSSLTPTLGGSWAGELDPSTRRCDRSERCCPPYGSGITAQVQWVVATPAD